MGWPMIQVIGQPLFIDNFYELRIPSYASIHDHRCFNPDKPGRLRDNGI